MQRLKHLPAPVTPLFNETAAQGDLARGVSTYPDPEIRNRSYSRSNEWKSGQVCER